MTIIIVTNIVYCRCCSGDEAVNSNIPSVCSGRKVTGAGRDVFRSSLFWSDASSISSQHKDPRGDHQWPGSWYTAWTSPCIWTGRWQMLAEHSCDNIRCECCSERPSSDNHCTECPSVSSNSCSAVCWQQVCCWVELLLFYVPPDTLHHFGVEDVLLGRLIDDCSAELLLVVTWHSLLALQFLTSLIYFFAWTSECVKQWLFCGKLCGL